MMNGAMQVSGQLPKYISFVKQNRTIEQAAEIFRQRISDASLIYEKFSGEFNERVCPVCGFNEYARLEAFHGSFGVARCSRCSSIYVNPCPSMKALEFYYNECDCNAMYGKLLRSRHKSGSKILSERVEFLLGLIKTYLHSKSRIKILEIGCNSGAFLSELKEGLSAARLLERCQLVGIDIDKTAIEKNVDAGITLYASDAEGYAEASEEKYDLIIHFELIEHLQDPFGFMLSAGKLLNEGGLHHFHTPNALGFDNQALGYNDFRALAHGIFPPMHLQSFTPQNIVHFSLRAGYKVVQVDTPGCFDMDIVLNTLPAESASPFVHIHNIPKEYLAIFQHWLKLLAASSHMRCTLTK